MDDADWEQIKRGYEALPLAIRYRVSRQRSLTRCLKFRVLLRSSRSKNIRVFLNRERLHMVKLRIMRTTGAYPKH
jgi:hypothetical protein